MKLQENIHNGVCNFIQPRYCISVPFKTCELAGRCSDEYCNAGASVQLA